VRRIEAGRRHGHYDPRFWDGPGPATNAPRTNAGDGLGVWENEGGASRVELATAARPPRADWRALSRKYPGRRRHDLELLVAWRDRG
jgi:hypothetical protein